MLQRKVAVKLGLQLRELEGTAARLAEVGLIDARTFQPTGWNTRQYVSDSDPTATERKRRQRERQRAKDQELAGVTNRSRVTVTDVTRTDTEKETTTTEATQLPGPTLEVPSKLETEREVVVGLLSGLDTRSQQQVLDELAGALLSENPPRKPMSWLRAVAEKARQGTFMPDLALAIGEARKRRRIEVAKAWEDQQRARAVSARRQDPAAQQVARTAMEAIGQTLGVRPSSKFHALELAAQPTRRESWISSASPFGWQR